MITLLLLTLAQAPDAGTWTTGLGGPPGSLSKEEIRQAIDGQHATVVACYEAALARDGQNTQGAMRIKFTIGSDGTVTEASVADPHPTHTLTFQQCVLDAMRKVKSKPPRGGGPVKVVYPFRFKH